MKPALAELQQPPIAYIWRQIRIHLFTHYFSFLTFQLWFELFVEWRLICVGYCHGSQCCWLFCRCIDLICFYRKVLMVKVDHFSWSACAKLPQFQSLVLHFFFSRYGKYGMLALFGRGRSNSAESISRCSRERCRALSCWATSVYAHSWCVCEWVSDCLLFDAFALNGPLHLFLKRRKMRKYACQSHGFKMIISGTMLEYSRWNWNKWMLKGKSLKKYISSTSPPQNQSKSILHPLEESQSKPWIVFLSPTLSIIPVWVSNLLQFIVGL